MKHRCTGLLRIGRGLRGALHHLTRRRPAPWTAVAGLCLATLGATLFAQPLFAISVQQPVHISAVELGRSIAIAAASPSPIPATRYPIYINALGLSADPAGGLYAAGACDVLHYGGTSTTADRIYGARGCGPAASAATLGQVFGISADPAGGLYVADRSNSRALHFSGTGTIADRVYGQKDFLGVFPFADGKLPNSSAFGHPNAVGVDSTGGVYIADYDQNRVLHFTGTSTTSDRVYTSRDSFVRPEANLGVALALAADPAGGLYVGGQTYVLHFSGTSTTPDRVYGQAPTGFNSANARSLSGANGVAVDPAGGIFVADTEHNRVLHFSGVSTTADRVYGEHDDFTRTDASQGQLRGEFGLYKPLSVAVDPNGGVYVADQGANQYLTGVVGSRVLHFSGDSTMPDRMYLGEETPPNARIVGGGASPSQAASAGGGAVVPVPEAPVAPIPAAPDLTAPPSSTPDWASILSAQADPRINVRSCDSPDPRNPDLNLCINGAYAALDLVTYGDIVADGGLEAVLPLESGGSTGQVGSLVFRLDGAVPRLVIADGPGGSVSIDASNNVLVSLGPDPTTSCASINCFEGVLRTTYVLVDDALVVQGACTYVPEPSDVRQPQGDCTAVQGRAPVP